MASKQGKASGQARSKAWGETCKAQGQPRGVHQPRGQLRGRSRGLPRARSIPPPRLTPRRWLWDSHRGPPSTPRQVCVAPRADAPHLSAFAHLTAFAQRRLLLPDPFQDAMPAVTEPLSRLQCGARCDAGQVTTLPSPQPQKTLPAGISRDPTPEVQGQTKVVATSNVRLVPVFACSNCDSTSLRTYERQAFPA